MSSNAVRMYLNEISGDSTRDFRRRTAAEEDNLGSINPKINRVERVHWYIKDNARLHHSIKFDQVHDQSQPCPVLRRGQTFYMAMRFKNRDFDIKNDRVVLNFKFGPTPSLNKGTMAVVPVDKMKFTGTKDDWDCRIDSGSHGQDLVLQVFVPASVPVGKWNLVVRCGLQDRSQGTEMFVYREQFDIYILFNPWCKDDSVFLDDDTMREEYVLNETGKAYVGGYKRPRGRPWAYGQFDEVVLPVACYILALQKLPFSQWGNPVKVVRAISAGVNHGDDGGLLEGRWDGDYHSGVSPFKWTGSVRILEQFIKNGYSHVKYAQCWVFAGVTTTICRALGIPCRPVTNYVSAHDTNSSLTVDKFFDLEGNEIEGGPDGDNYDSIWNFHVWNDVWMARPDLPPGYGGWQAIDATPQEESDHKFQCGPASLEAVKRGDVGLAYDCPFVFAEVNADIMHWGEDPESPWNYSRIKMNKFHIGRSVITKIAGEDDDFDKNKENVVDMYKNKDGTPLERLAIHNAIRGSRRAQLYYGRESDKAEDVVFDLTEIDSIKVGDSFKVKVVIRNESNEHRTVTAALTARSIFYTGVHFALLKKAEGNLIIEPKKEQDVALSLSYKEYWTKLQEHCMIKMYVICHVKETGQTWSDEDDFQVEKPDLTIQIPNQIKRGENCEAELSFKNPLQMELTECTVSIDGAGLLRSKEINISDPVPSEGVFKYKFNFLPRIQGTRKLLASFNSRELNDITGSRTVQVVK